MIELANSEFRKAILKEIESNENKSRKRESFIQNEIYRDRQGEYVRRYLLSQFSENTVKEMPIISSINLTKKIVNQEASIYKNEPKRVFKNVSDQQQDALLSLYKTIKANNSLKKANRQFKLQGQSFLYVVPDVENKTLSIKILLPHHFDVIPDEKNPEKAAAFIISAYDRSSIPSTDQNKIRPHVENLIYSDSFNQKIADTDDYKVNQKFIVWSNEFNFIMNGNGDILSEDIENPLGIIPIVDISDEKEMEFFVRLGQSIADFSIQFNAALSDLANIVRLQGWGQAYLKGPKEMLPENLVIGVNRILKLPTDPNTGMTTEFGYINPNSDIEGSMRFVESLLSMFLTSRGIDPKSIVTNSNNTNNFSSGFERLLAMIDKFEATKDDFDLFQSVEKKLFQIIAQYVNVYGGSDYLPDWTFGKIDENATIEIEFSKPEMVQTDAEKLAIIEKKLSLGLITEVEAIAIDRDISILEAKEIHDAIQKETVSMING